MEHRGGRSVSSVAPGTIAIAVGATTVTAAAAYFWFKRRCRDSDAGTSVVVPDQKCIAVYCASSSGHGPNAGAYQEAANRLGKALVENGLGLVYGGGNVGLMGIVSQSVDREGGKVYGVIPKALNDHERTGVGVQSENLQVVNTMHQRKERMARMSSAFIALPGGFGTMEELLEAITWCQLSVHDKPVGVLNVNGYYDPFCQQIKNGVENGLIPSSFQDMVVIESDPEVLVRKILTYKTPQGLGLHWEHPEDVI